MQEIKYMKEMNVYKLCVRSLERTRIHSDWDTLDWIYTNKGDTKHPAQTKRTTKIDLTDTSVRFIATSGC